ncbi:predicted protein [Sclerotinia sclerotiorum 1980 UF-70]|uniref:Uncharacterized protein n=1 Tax=Sclerotinia sclerotiorum (strain ATCC 18683 / 1980 / Ss-1) TaxID=665079 RepID=A7ETD6_SCLS1|nr:predicted protein [Sclerotinia sclerotiorum 1980 UF-70]EDN92728.1 predicted protein [Sclerotinia sclerotiorum 1980 UF-70]
MERRTDRSDLHDNLISAEELHGKTPRLALYHGSSVAQIASERATRCSPTGTYNSTSCLLQASKAQKRSAVAKFTATAMLAYLTYSIGSLRDRDELLAG